MAPIHISPHRRAWKNRLASALTERPTSTAVLARLTAVPAKAASQLLEQLRLERLAIRDPRSPIGSGGRYHWTKPEEAPHG